MKIIFLSSIHSSSSLGTVSFKKVVNHHGYFYSALNNSVVLHLYHFLKSFSQEMRLLPILLLPCILPCIITCNNKYFSPLITWPRYWSFLVLIVFIIFVSIFIFPRTSVFDTLSTQLNLKILL